MPPSDVVLTIASPRSVPCSWAHKVPARGSGRAGPLRSPPRGPRRRSSSRARRTWTRTPRPGCWIGSPARPRRRGRIELDAEEAEPRPPRTSRALADPGRTSASRPPAPPSPTAPARRWTNTATASPSGSSSRMSASRRASRPEARFSSRSTLRDAPLAERVEERARVDRAAAGRHRTPSNGVKPMVVSTERPSSTAVTAAAAEVADDEPRHALGARLDERPWKPTGAHSSRHRAGRAYAAAASGVERRVEHRDLRHVRSARAASSIPRSAGALWSGASASSARISSCTTTGSRKRAPPWTTRWPTASRAGPSDSTGRDSSPSTRWSLMLVEPALTTDGQTQSARPDRPRRARACSAAASARPPSPAAAARRARPARARGRSRP